jgi:hypothetical protein
LEEIKGILHVVSLINVAELANVTEPSTYQPGGLCAKDRTFFIHVRLRARELLAWLNSRFDICILSGAVLDLREFAEEYLSYQMVVMRIRKDFYDGRTMTSPVSHITAEELDKELHGCRQEFSTALLDDELDDVPCLLLPQTHRYTVVLKELVDMPVDISGETFSDREWYKSTKVSRGHHSRLSKSFFG